MAPRTLLRRLVFALLPAALLFGGAELGLRAAGVAPVTAAEALATERFYEGAYVHRRDMEARPWFVVEGDTARSNPRLVPRGFHDQQFPAVPPAGERRVFALGGSTTQGAPYEHKTRGFSQLLEERLGSEWRVVNAGVAGLDSTRFGELAQEAAELGAEALVVYAGNNEVSGRLIDGCLHPGRVGIAAAIDRWRTLRVAKVWVESWRPPAVPSRDELIQNQDDCMRQFLDGALAGHVPEDGPHREDLLARLTREVFRHSLEEVVDVGLPVVIAVPPIHLLPPPVAPRSSPALDRPTAQAVERAWHALERSEGPQRAGVRASAELDELLAADPTHAGLRWARGLRDLDDPALRERALEDLHRAVDWDHRGTRITRPLQQVIRDLCAAHETVTCVDVAARFAAAAPDGIPGEALFVDHCHPTWRGGTPLIAEAFAEALPGMVAP